MRQLGTKTGTNCWIPVLVLLLAVTAPGQTASPQNGPGDAVDLLLVFAVDVSESINRREAALQRIGHANALVDKRVVAAIGRGKLGRIAIAYLEWAGPGEQREVIGWTQIGGMADARLFRDALLAAPVSTGYWTSISAALDKASRMIAAAPFTAERRVIDLSSDGRNNAGAPLGPVRKRVLRQGITINGLPVIAMRRNFTWPPLPHLDRYFAHCVIGGPGAFSEVVEGYSDVARAVRRKLIREIAGTGQGRAEIVPVSGPSPPRCREEGGPASGNKS